MANACTIINSSSSVRTILYNSGAVDADMNIINKEKVDKLSKELAEDIFISTNIEEDIIIPDKSGKVFINEEAINRLKVNEITHVVAPKRFSYVDKTFINKVFQHLEKITPKLNILILNDKEILENYGKKGDKAKGFLDGDGNIVLNAGAYTVDTPFHEFGHLIMRHLKLNDVDSYNTIIEKAKESAEFKLIQIANPEISDEINAEEIFINKIGIRSVHNFTKDIGIYRKVKNILRDIVYDVFGVRIGKISMNDSFQSIINKFSDDIISADSGLFSELNESMHEGLLSTKSYSEETMKDQLVYEGYIKKIGDTEYFYDKDGKLSEDYYKNLTKYDADRALSAYVESMRSVVELRFQKQEIKDVVAEAVKQHKKLEKASRNRTGKGTNRGVTSIYTDGVDGKEGFESESDRSAINIARARDLLRVEGFAIKQDELLKQNEKNREFNKKVTKVTDKRDIFSTDEIKDLSKTAGEKAANKPSKRELNVKVREVESLDNFKQDHGVIIHDVADDYMLLRKELMEEGSVVVEYMTEKGKETVKLYKSKKDSLSDLQRFTSLRKREIYKYINGKRVPVVVDGKRGFPAPWKYSKIQRNREGYLRELEDVLKEFEKGKGPIEYFSEFRISDDKLGFNGIIDLLAIDMSNGKAYIFDHKTKEKNKIKNWNYDQAPYLINENFSQYRDTAATRTSIQASMYRIILDRMGFNTQDSHVLYTEGDIINAVDGNNVDNKFRQYFDIKVSKLKLTDMREALLQEFLDKGFDVNKIINPNKNDIFDTFMEISEGEAMLDDYEMSDELAEKLLDRIKEYETHSGDKYYGLKYRRKLIKFKRKDKASRIAKIKREFNSRTLILEQETKMEELFETNGESKSVDFHTRKILLNNMGGRTKDTHEFIRFSDDPMFGRNYAGIVAFRNKKNGEYTFLLLQNFSPKYVENSGIYTTMFKKYMSDSHVKRVAKGESDIYVGNSTMFKMAKMATLIAKLKQNDASVSVDYMYATRPMKEVRRGGADDPLMFEKTSIMKSTELLLKQASEHGDTKSDVEDLIKDSSLWGDNSYENDFVNNSINMLKEIKVSLDFKSETRDTLIEELEKQNNDPGQDVHDLIIAIDTYLEYNKRNEPEEERHLRRTLLHLKGVATAFISQDIHAFSKYLIIPAHSESLFVTQMNRIARESRSRARFIFLDHRAEHNAALDKSWKSAIIRKGIFKDLIEIDPNNAEGSYKFKEGSENHPYVKYFKATMLKALLSTSDGELNRTHIENYVKEGFIPLVNTSFTARLKSGAPDESYAESIRTSLMQRNKVAKENEVDKYTFSNTFASETGDNPNIPRSKKMQADENGKFETKFETNLEVILDLIVAESSLVKYGKSTLHAAQSLNTELIYQKKNFKHSADNVEMLLEVVARVYVKGEYGGKSRLDRSINTMGKVASITAIAFSPASIALELVTNLANINRLLIQEGLMNKIFKVPSLFGAGDLALASTKILTDGTKANLMMDYLGIMESDPTRMQALLTKTKNWKLFKSENLYAAQHAILRYTMLNIAVASMIADGSYDAYSVVDGKLEYSPKKDRRYFNSNGNFHKTKYNTKEENEAKFKFNDDRLKAEGKVRDDGTYIVGHTTTEMNMVKDYLVEAFSSMDDDSRGAIAMSFFGKMQMKFKGWLAPKVARAVGLKSEGRAGTVTMEYIRGEDGELHAVEVLNPAEGYLFTLSYLLNAGFEKGSTRSIKDMTNFERKQMSSLASDLTMIGILLGLKSLASCDESGVDTQTGENKCWWKRNYLYEILYKALDKSMSDVVAPIALYDLATQQSAAIPAAGVASGLIKNSWKAGIYLTEGDAESAAITFTNSFASLKHFNKFMGYKVPTLKE